jgi:hypothetical protein
MDTTSLTYSQLVQWHEDWHQEIECFLAGGQWYGTACNLQSLHTGQNPALEKTIPPKDLEAWRSTSFNLLTRTYIAAWQASGHSQAAQKLLEWFRGRKGATVELLRAAVYPDHDLQLRLDDMVSRFHGTSSRKLGAQAPKSHSDWSRPVPQTPPSPQVPPAPPAPQPPAPQAPPPAPQVLQPSQAPEPVVCCVCQDRIPNRVIITCGHTMCHICHEDPRVTACPLCNGPHNPVIKLFL